MFPERPLPLRGSEIKRSLQGGSEKRSNMINLNGKKGKKTRVVLAVVVIVIIVAMLAGAIIAAFSFG